MHSVLWVSAKPQLYARNFRLHKAGPQPLSCGMLTACYLVLTLRLPTATMLAIMSAMLSTVGVRCRPSSLVTCTHQVHMRDGRHPATGPAQPARGGRAHLELFIKDLLHLAVVELTGWDVQVGQQLLNGLQLCGCGDGVGAGYDVAPMRAGELCRQDVCARDVPDVTNPALAAQALTATAPPCWQAAVHNSRLLQPQALKLGGLTYQAELGLPRPRARRGRLTQTQA